MLTGIVMLIGALGIAAIFAVIAGAIGLGLAFGAISQLRRRLRPGDTTAAQTPLPDLLGGQPASTADERGEAAGHESDGSHDA